MNEQAPKPLSASLVTYNSAKEIDELLQSLQAHLDLSKIEVYLIDNASTDDTVAIVQRSYPWVTVICNQHNRGFGAAHNQVIERLRSEYHAVINPDIIFLEDSLCELADYLCTHPVAVMATPRILNRDGTEQYLPKLLPTPRYLLARRLFSGSRRAQKLDRAYTRRDEEFTVPTPIEQATGSCFVIRTAALRELGGFDERFFLYFEDNDLSRRAAQLGQIIFFPGTAVVHGYAQSSKTSLRAFGYLLHSAVRYFRKHGWSG